MNTSIIQISAGKGPEECQRAAFMVAEAWEKQLNNAGLQWEVASHENGAIPRSYLSITYKVNGDTRALQQEWEGSILWVGISPFRPSHKRKNWFVAIQFFAFQEFPAFKESDVVYETCRASGPGGQNVNKVETAVRAKHVPSGTQVVSMESRTQIENKKRSLAKLKNLFYQQQLAFLADQKLNAWEQHQQVERGNAIKTFKGPLK